MVNDTIQSLNCVVHYHNFCTSSFNKLTFSFVGIEVLPCFNKTKFQFYCSRELSVFELFKTFLCKNDFLNISVYIKLSRKKNCI